MGRRAFAVETLHTTEAGAGANEVAMGVGARLRLKQNATSIVGMRHERGKGGGARLQLKPGGFLVAGLYLTERL